MFNNVSETQNILIIVALIVGFSIGLFVGYRIWGKQKQWLREFNASATFIGMVLLGYLFFTPQPDPIIAVALISVVAGVPIGEKLAQKVGVKNGK